MSVDWLSKAWVTETGSPTKKSVLIALADRCDQDGVCWPSYRDVMERTELGRTAVRVAIEELQVDGVIRAWDRARPDGSQTSNGYKLLIDGIKRGGAARRQGGAASEHGGVPPDDTLEPSVEPSGRLVKNGALRRKMNNPPDDSSAGRDDESPSLGSATARRTEDQPVRQSTQIRSWQGLAKDMDRRLRIAGFYMPVNIQALTGSMKKWGVTLEDMSAMVDVFVANPDRYLKADEVPWIGFIRQREVLKTDARKFVGWDEDSGADPYANEKIVG